MSDQMIFVDRARMDDVELIMELEESGFDPRDQWSERSWQQELISPDRSVFVSRAGDGGLLGVVTVQVVGDTADLLRVVVAGGSRRRGVGRTLVERAARAARGSGATRMLLEVAAGNAAARALYERTGFAPMANRTGYYGPGKDAVVMRRSLIDDEGDR